MATFKFLDINGVSTLLNQLKNTFVKKTDVENSFSDDSTNPVQNKIIKAALDDKVDKVDGKQLSTEDFTTELKTKLDGIDPDATKITIDEELSSTSTNPVQNKVINAALGEKVPTANVTSTISSTDGSKIPTSQAVIDYVEENGGGGGGGSIAIAEDIPVTLLSTGWTGDSAPYSQQVTVLDMREGMTPLIFLQGQATDEQIYAYNLITDYQVGNGTITFYVAETPEVDIPIVLKGVPAQEIGYMDNTILVPVTASGFSLSESTGRYEQTITVSGMTAGLGGSWDIARSGEVLSEEESKIAASITDVIRQTNAIKIVCLEMPEQDYTIVLSGTFKDVAEGDIVLSGVGTLIDRVDTLEENMTDILNSNNSVLLWTNTSPTSEFAGQTINIDLNEYDGVEVEFQVTSIVNMYAKAIKGKRAIPQYISILGYVKPRYIQVSSRTFAVDNTSIQFFDGLDNLTNEDASTTNNNTMIPLRIWGLKTISN